MDLTRVCACALPFCACALALAWRGACIHTKIATYKNANTEYSARAPPHHAGISLVYLLTPRMRLWGWVHAVERACDGFGFYDLGKI